MSNLNSIIERLDNFESELCQSFEKGLKVTSDNLITINQILADLKKLQAKQDAEESQLIAERDEREEVTINLNGASK